MIAALPSFLFHDLKEKLPMSLDARLMSEQRTPLAKFCATQATLYVTHGIHEFMLTKNI